MVDPTQGGRHGPGIPRRLNEPLRTHGAGLFAPCVLSGRQAALAARQCLAFAVPQASSGSGALSPLQPQILDNLWDKTWPLSGIVGPEEGLTMMSGL